MADSVLGFSGISELTGAAVSDVLHISKYQYKHFKPGDTSITITDPDADFIQFYIAAWYCEGSWLNIGSYTPSPTIYPLGISTASVNWVLSGRIGATLIFNSNNQMIFSIKQIASDQAVVLFFTFKLGE